MSPSQPNVLVITTHDSGRMFGCYGNPTVRTPRIDRLAHNGVLFENMNATCPICSPSRGALLTGRYPLANGLVGLAGGSWNWEMNDYHQHLSHLLHDAGYSTALFGLQHETVHIDRMGFDEVSPRDKKSAVEVADDACSYLRGGPDGPFYMQVGFFETHTPYDYADCEPDDENGVWVPPFATTHDWPGWARLLNRRFGEDPEGPRRHLAELQGSLHRVDCAVGKILDALADAGLDRNTIVLYNTDHGPELPGAKWTMYDPGVGVAFIMRWPEGGVAGGRRCPWMLSNVDFVPTLFELLDLEPPENLQGSSFARACREYVEGVPSTREVAFGNWVDGLNFSARTDRYKLIRNLVPVDSTGRECPEYELYDLAIDPLEITDVAREPAYEEAFEQMKEHLDGWLTEMDDPVVHGPIEGEEHEEMIANYRSRYEARH